MFGGVPFLFVHSKYNYEMTIVIIYNAHAMKTGQSGALHKNINAHERDSYHAISVCHLEEL